MPEITITVTEKIAAAQGSPMIVCGNSDYAVKFIFDSEWDRYAQKTAHIRYFRNGRYQYDEVLFEGDTVEIPALYGTFEAEIGVFAGDIHTTTPARIPCARCITDGAPVHADPQPDVYNQLLEYLAAIQNGEPFAFSDVQAVSAGGVSEDIFAIAEEVS